MKPSITLGRRGAAAAIAAVAGIGLLAAANGAKPKPPTRPAYLAAFPNFAPNVTPQFPGDVDIALKTALEKVQKFPEVQREFDLYSWQMFFALNWPTNNQGKAAPSLTNTSFGAPHWTLWHNSSSIFQPDGATPAACGFKSSNRPLLLRRDLSKPVSRGLKAFSAAATANADPRATRFLGVISAVGELNASNLSDIKQAFSGPLVDQYGEFVYYEIMIDPQEVDYLCANNLYNINGQVAFSQGGGKVNMPFGTPHLDWSGSTELKFAWRILQKGKDDFSRFYTTPAVVIDLGPDGQQVERKVTVGLVGMHIAHKSSTSPQWIWSTFEQVDNLDVDPVAHPNLKPNFTDPSCPICTVNLQPAKSEGGVYSRIPTQAWRAIPIPGDKKALNGQVQASLRRMGSVWQYYELIDTQWPTQPNAPPSPWDGGLPDAVTNKAGGRVTPVMLTNITMETYFQKGNQPACNGEETPSSYKGCGTDKAAPPVWDVKLNNLGHPVKPGTNTSAFMTESCTGCHSSAGIYTSYDPKTGDNTQSGQLTGDFSWLMAQKASYANGAPPVAPLKAKVRAD
ncbi:MAG: hypothetical protein ABI471_06010 [Sphingomonas bacterium]